MGGPATGSSSRIARTLSALRSTLRSCVLIPLGMSSRIKLVHSRVPLKVGSFDLMDVIRAKCPSLIGEKATYTPTPWLFNGHLQTIYCTVADFSKVDVINYERHLIRLPDGGTLGLDFTIPLPTDAEDIPILVCLHGLTGGSHESYVRSVIASVTKPANKGGPGWRGVVVNFRGCAGVEITGQKLYHGGQTDDLRCALLYISAAFPSSPLYGAGFSLGANSLAKYLSEEGDLTPLKGACVLGNPWNLRSNKLLEGSWVGRVYAKAMAGNLRVMFSRHLDTFAASDKLDIAAIFNNPKQTISDFESLVTVPISNFESVEHYYSTQSTNDKTATIRVPLLCLNAADDPIAIASVDPKTATDSNPNIFFVQTRHGGHLGWFQGFFKPSRWVNKPVAEWFAAIHHADPTNRPNPGIGPSQTPVCIGGNMVVHKEKSSVGFQLVSICRLEGGEGTEGMVKGL